MRSNRIRLTTFAATALVAALSLTACGGDDGADAKKPAPAGSVADQGAASPTPDTPAAPEKDSTSPTDSEPAADTREKAPAAKPGTESKPASKPKPKTPVTCTGANTRTTVTKVSRPINHLLLTVTNKGDRPCYAYYAPMLRFDDAQAVFQVFRDSKPQAVVTLDPGASAYAGIALTGEPTGKKPYKSANLGVTFADRANAPVNSSPAELKLPAETYWDDNGFVTYWQSEMSDALVY
ncbi:MULTISPECIES: DUF4232 domain-containing protein [unclassified Streptomyces]|uniref:DUF4232 domain-containing protein n=1 Tax=unclassified Streptomyces TaxID=2593676 RepID=UPI000DADFF83|nr:MULTISPECIES: DUF4232 domain-containing protein [unclassified Streptomyces]PZT72468.1 hypothetical protein DNK55_28500 [Streptomyces sp. AC1-42T]PZT81214.1 hypothetical protein DNK56_03070 [Streptomyces sp. AC1-42W]